MSFSSPYRSRASSSGSPMGRSLSSASSLLTTTPANTPGSRDGAPLEPSGSSLGQSVWGGSSVHIKSHTPALHTHWEYYAQDRTPDVTVSCSSLSTSAAARDHDAVSSQASQDSFAASSLDRSRISVVSVPARAKKPRNSHGRRYSVGTLQPANSDSARIFRTPVSAPGNATWMSKPPSCSTAQRKAVRVPVDLQGQQRTKEWAEALAIAGPHDGQRGDPGRALRRASSAKKVMSRMKAAVGAQQLEGVDELGPAGQDSREATGFSSEESEDEDHGLHGLSTLLAQQIRRSRSSRHRRDPSATLSEAEQVNISSSVVDTPPLDQPTRAPRVSVATDTTDEDINEHFLLAQLPAGEAQAGNGTGSAQAGNGTGSAQAFGTIFDSFEASAHLQQDGAGGESRDESRNAEPSFRSAGVIPEIMAAASSAADDEDSAWHLSVGSVKHPSMETTRHLSMDSTRHLSVDESQQGPDFLTAVCSSSDEEESPGHLHMEDNSQQRLFMGENQQSPESPQGPAGISPGHIAMMQMEQALPRSADGSTAAYATPASHISPASDDRETSDEPSPPAPGSGNSPTLGRAQMGADGIRALMSGTLTPDDLRRSIRFSDDASSSAHSPLSGGPVSAGGRMHLQPSAWLRPTPPQARAAQSGEEALRSDPFFTTHDTSLSSESSAPATPSSSVAATTGSGAFVTPLSVAGRAHDTTVFWTPPSTHRQMTESRALEAPATAPVGRGTRSFKPTPLSTRSLLGSGAGVGFQPLSEESLEDVASYREVEAEVARALEELNRQQDGDTHAAAERRKRAEALRKHWRSESSAAAERMRLAGLRLVQEANAYKQRTAAMAEKREMLQRELETAVAEASEMGVEHAAAEIAAEGASLGAQAAGRVKEEAERLQQCVRFGEASVLADAQCRLQAACAELERCKMVATVQKARIEEVKSQVENMSTLEIQISEISTELMKLAELSALARGHLGTVRMSNEYPHLRASPLVDVYKSVEKLDRMLAGLPDREERVKAAVRNAMQEGEAEATGADGPLEMLTASFLALDTDDEVWANQPSTVADARHQMNEVLGRSLNSTPSLSPRASPQTSPAFSRGGLSDRSQVLMSGRSVQAASQELQWELGPAIRLALCLLVTRLREVRATVSTKGVEQMRSEAAASAAEAMCGAITRRKAAAEAEVMHLESEYQQSVTVNSMDEVQRYAVGLEQQAKEQASEAALAATSQMAKLEEERERISAEIIMDVDSLVEMRTSLEACWAEVKAGQEAYRKVRARYQRQMERIFSGEGISDKEADMSPKLSPRLGPNNLCDPGDIGAIHSALAELLQRAQEELLLPASPLPPSPQRSLEQGAEPKPLPREAELLAAHRSADGAALSHVSLPRAAQSSSPDALRMSNGSSVVLGETFSAIDVSSSMASNGSRQTPSRHPMHGAYSAATSRPSTGMGAAAPQRTLVFSPAPELQLSESPLIPSASSERPGKRRSAGGRDRGPPPMSGRNGSRQKANPVRPAKPPQGQLQQWKYVKAMLAGQVLFTVEQHPGKAGANGRKTSLEGLLPSENPSAAVDGAVAVLTLSSDYSRLILRRQGCNLSSYIRIAEVLDITYCGRQPLVVPDHGLSASVSQVVAADKSKSASRLKNKPKLVPAQLPAFVISLPERQMLLATRTEDEKDAWVDGVTLLITNKKQLSRLKATLAAMQYPALFGNSDALR